MLCELSGIIVQQITKGIHRLRDGCGKESILFWQIFRKSDKKVKRPGLLLTCQFPESQIRLQPALKDGMSSWARPKDFVWCDNFECNSWPRPSASPSLGTAIIHVLWSEGIISLSAIWREDKVLDVYACFIVRSSSSESESQLIALAWVRTTMLFVARNSRLLSRHSRAMSSHAIPLLLSPAQVHDLIESSQHGVSLLDASWFMPDSPRKPYEEFLAGRIPGAQFLDLDQVASLHELGLKHMMPPSRVFANACGTIVKLVSVQHAYKNIQKNME